MFNTWEDFNCFLSYSKLVVYSNVFWNCILDTDKAIIKKCFVFGLSRNLYQVRPRPILNCTSRLPPPPILFSQNLKLKVIKVELFYVFAHICGCEEISCLLPTLISLLKIASKQWSFSEFCPDMMSLMSLSSFSNVSIHAVLQAVEIPAPPHITDGSSSVTILVFHLYILDRLMTFHISRISSNFPLVYPELFVGCPFFATVRNFSLHSLHWTG
jgi:hypothetical protein